MGLEGICCGSAGGYFGGGQFDGRRGAEISTWKLDWRCGEVKKDDWPSKRERHKKALSSKVRDLPLPSEQLAAIEGL